MRQLALLLLCLVVVGCGSETGPTTFAPSFSTAPSASAALSSTAPATSAGGQRAEVLEGAFQLAFALPKDTWRTNEAIDGVATLALVNGSGMDLGASGSGLLQFEFEEVNGSRHVLPVSTSDCAPYRIDRGAPMTWSLAATHKSVGYTAGDPNAAFYSAFIADPAVHLPVGDWRITAIADFIEGRGCSGLSHTMRATVLVHVTG